MLCIKPLRLVFMIFVLFTLAACGGGGGDKTVLGLPATGTEIGGYVIDGPISGSSVTLNRINSTGSVGEQVAGPFMTDANGQWSGTIPDNVTGTLVVVATGGQYTDDVTGDVVVLAASDTLNSWFDTASPDIKGVVSPVTDSLWQVIEQGMSNGDTLDTSVGTAERIATDFWGVDPTRTLPDINSSTDINQRYGAILGGYSFIMENRAEFQQEPFISMSRFTLMRLIMDDMADGKLDGIAIDGSPITAANGAAFPALSPNDLSALFENANEFASEQQIPPLGQSYFESYPPIFDCTPTTCPTFAIGGSVTGLSGSLILQNNAGDDLTVSENSPFSFSSKLSSGAEYNVTILNAPASQSCSVTSGATGTVNGADISSVQIECSNNASPTYTIGGSVTGLSGSLVLQNNSGDSKTITGNGGFVFTTALQSGSAYSVTVSSSPATQNCSVTMGASGTIGNANISNVQVSCSAIASPTYTIGGNVTGLSGIFTLQNNGGDSKTINMNGGFEFNTAMQSGSAYSVTVSSSPATQNCTITMGASGTIGNANISNVQVNCSAITSPTYTIGGNVTGLNGKLILKNNGDDSKTINADGGFEFNTALQSGSAYSIKIFSSPVTQNCSITSGATGTVGSANIGSVVVECANLSTYTISGSVSGLSNNNQGLVLQNNKNVDDEIFKEVNGSFIFGTTIVDGAVYLVEVYIQPQDRVCSVINASGTVNGANVENVEVNCIVKTFTVTSTADVGGSISPAGNIVVNYFDSQLYSITPDTGYQIADILVDGVSVGAANSYNLQNIRSNQTISASFTPLPTYSIGVTVSGLANDESIILQNNGGDDLSISSNDFFVFPISLLDGKSYLVWVSIQPTQQICTASNNIGNISGSNISDVAINCENNPANQYFVSGTVSGLATGSNLVLQNNGSDSLAVSVNGSFTFTASVANASSYNVTVLTYPTGQGCTVSNQAGNINGGNVTNVAVNCGTDPIHVSIPIANKPNTSKGTTSERSSLSNEGSVIAFSSFASNLVINDNNGTWDVFMRSIPTNETIRVSVASDGTEAVFVKNLPPLLWVGLSDTGGTEPSPVIVYHSPATNLVADDNNSSIDVFTYNLVTDETTRISLSSSGGEANGDSVIHQSNVTSGLGHIVFHSLASNLVSGDTNQKFDIFRRKNGETIRVSVAEGGAQANNNSTQSMISADGNIVVFVSLATNLVAGDTNGVADLFLRNIQNDTTIRINKAPDNTQANAGSGMFGGNYGASLSMTGRYIAFNSDASNLVPDDTNNAYDTFVYDTDTGVTTRVSVTSNGAQADITSGTFTYGTAISSDGRYVVFFSDAANLVENDDNARGEVFVHDMQTGKTAMVAVSGDGVQGDNRSRYPAISADGQYISFTSASTNLADSDTTTGDDIFRLANPLYTENN